MPAEPGLAATLPTQDSASAPFALGVRESFSARGWRFKPADEELVRALALSGVSPPLARLLAARGVSTEAAPDYLDPRLKSLLPDPEILVGMEAAVARLADAITQREQIAILGDYDVDGACSSALLLRFLRGCGLTPLLYIPDRITEGYGPSAEALRKLGSMGATLVLTVDCGAGARAALASARADALDVIVLDHHAVEIDPPAFAHVNPNGPSDRSGLGQVCAAGIVFLVLVAVQRALRRRDFHAANAIAEIDLLKLLDIVALATVADVVPLTGINRAFVRQGLKILDRLERPGFAALAEIASATPPFSPYTLGYAFGPRINAGGRVGQCDLGARLLSSEDADETRQLATLLDHHNRERQSVELAILASAEAMALAQGDSDYLFCASDGWHPGVVGIVASRLKDRFNKPALVAGFMDSLPSAVARGSARSVPGIDIGSAIRAAVAEGLLESGGGHAMAAGFSVRRAALAPLKAFLDARFASSGLVSAGRQELHLDGLVSPAAATLAFMAEYDRAGPFGAGNPEPLFALPDVMVAYAGTVGTSHVKLRLVGRDGAGMAAIAFRAADTPLGRALLKSRGARIHVVGRLRRDDYGGRLEVQLQMEDAASATA